MQAELEDAERRAEESATKARSLEIQVAAAQYAENKASISGPIFPLQLTSSRPESGAASSELFGAQLQGTAQSSVALRCKCAQLCIIRKIDLRLKVLPIVQVAEVSSGLLPPCADM